MKKITKVGLAVLGGSALLGFAAYEGAKIGTSKTLEDLCIEVTKDHSDEEESEEETKDD